LDSCTTVFISQGISLHYNSHNKTAIYQTLAKKYNIF